MQANPRGVASSMKTSTSASLFHVRNTSRSLATSDDKELSPNAWTPIVVPDMGCIVGGCVKDESCTDASGTSLYTCGLSPRTRNVVRMCFQQSSSCNSTCALSIVPDRASATYSCNASGPNTCAHAQSASDVCEEKSTSRDGRQPSGRSEKSRRRASSNTRTRMA